MPASLDKQQLHQTAAFHAKRRLMGRPMLGAPRNSSGREQLELLWPLTEGRRVEKVRYLVPTGSCEVEVDVFEGKLAGMITAEMEFDSEAASDAFEPRIGSAPRSRAMSATRTRRLRPEASPW